MNNIDLKRESEKELIKKMIMIYCKGHHHAYICEECNDLLIYAIAKIDNCPFMETKTFCSQCKIHCYRSKYKMKIKEVMKYTGPRMLLIDPLVVIKHFIDSRKKESSK
ncbi:nitrous oxide-stimulated promoter family protein [Anaerorhabdus sp.]|jgi:uncharacterized Fe-S cluster-containing protein|uniref:nitrous oxide-stimulated promoter family protein n=1 Tax=Anaerorhabdus sp. TaxID=1872524 RepID=UPI002FCAE1FE